MTSMLIVFSFMVGLLLGGFYFGGLWLTIRRLPNNEMAGLWLLASFVSRTVVVLIGFFLVSDGQWERIAICLVGFLVARTAMVKFLVGINGRAKLLLSRDYSDVGSAGAAPSRVLLPSGNVPSKPERDQNGNR